MMVAHFFNDEYVRTGQSVFTPISGAPLCLGAAFHIGAIATLFFLRMENTSTGDKEIYRP
jgi:hypothetical protein